MAELTLGSLNLHMGRGTGGHDAPFYDVAVAAKEIDTDVLVLQEAWVPDPATPADPDALAHRGEPKSSAGPSDPGESGPPDDRSDPAAPGSRGGGTSPASGADDAWEAEATGQPPGNITDIACGLDYQVAATFAIARGTCHDQVRLVGREGPVGDGDWSIAVLARPPIRRAEVVPIPPQLPRDPGRRAVLVVELDVDGAPFTVVGTHMPLLKDPVWRLAPAIRAALPGLDRPAAFAGDMNMWGWCVDRLVPRGWRRAVRGRTYPAHRPHSQTDHILVTPAVEVIEAEVVPQAMSDHRPIRARLRFG